jgi:hypothetical protein
MGDGADNSTSDRSGESTAKLRDAKERSGDTIDTFGERADVFKDNAEVDGEAASRLGYGPASRLGLRSSLPHVRV